MSTIKSIEIDYSSMPAVSPLRSPVFATRGVYAAPSSGTELMAIFSHEQRNTQQALNGTRSSFAASTFAAMASVKILPMQGRRKRWKKPAKKRFRHYGLDVSNSVGYYPSSDEEETVQHGINAVERRRSERTMKKMGKTADCARHGTPAITVTTATTVGVATASSMTTRKPTKKASSSKATASKKPAKSSTNAHSTTSKIKSKAKSKIRCDVQPTDTPVPSNVPVAVPKTKSKKRPDEQRKLKIRSFDARVQDLKDFKDEHGHCRVPYTYKPNQPLSNWCSNLRYSYTQQMKNAIPTIRLTAERIQLLQDIGFDLGPAKGAEKKRKRDEHDDGNDSDEKENMDNPYSHHTRKRSRRSNRSARNL